MNETNEIENPQMGNAQWMDDPLWYKDAVIYELHIKAFYDSDNNGTGDFPGLIQKLDYIQDLGVNTLWLLPFYPSPMRDDGYDIADYRNIHPEYGTMADFKLFVKEAHRRGLKIITELVINHTSDQHPWFQAARRAPAGSSKRDFYVWSDSNQKFPETRIIFKDAERSNWTWDEEAHAYYWHRFFHHQPDLNFNNPQVVKAVIKLMRFWLDLGVDGMRLDAIPYLCVSEGTQNENLPGTHAVIKQMRAVVDAHYPTAFFSPKLISGRKMCVTTSVTAMNVTWPTIFRSCRECTWPLPRKIVILSLILCGRPQIFQTPANGRSFFVITTSLLWRWSLTKNVTICTRCM